MPGSPPYIAVAGPGEGAGARDRELARQVGRELARAGAVLLCGGLGGVMAAACEGAASGGGTAVGLLPGSDRSAGNPYLSVALATGLGELRNGLLVRAADAVITIGGSWGTLSEIALAIRTGRPVIALGGWQLAAGPASGTPGAARSPRGGPVPAGSAAEAVRLALAAAGGAEPAAGSGG